MTVLRVIKNAPPPPPKSRVGTVKAALAQLEVGDALDWKAKKVGGLRSAAHRLGFGIRIAYTGDDTWRVWRIR